MTPRLRLFLLVALAIGLWFARERLLPSDVVEADVKGARTAQRAPQPKPFDPSTAEVCTTPAALPERGHFAALGTGDPFTPPRPPAPKPAPVVAVAPPPPPPPPPAPPPLRVPYRLMGALSEKGVPVSVFLALGNAVINAKAGDELEGGFKLQSISARELVFVHQQLNQTVRLPVDGDPL